MDSDQILERLLDASGKASEQLAQHSIKLDTMQADINDLKTSTGLTSAAAIKIALICSATVLAIAKASGPIVTAITGMLK